MFSELALLGPARLDDVRGVEGRLDYNNVMIRGATATLVGRLTLFSLVFDVILTIYSRIQC